MTLYTQEGNDFLNKLQKGVMSFPELEETAQKYALKSIFDKTGHAHDVWYDLWTIESEYQD